jgi:CheY-like chemotaxis protein
MSSEYCRSLMEEMTNSDRPSGEIPEFVRFGPDKIANARKRQAYFKEDKWIQDIQPGDGSLLGHEAILKIRKQFQEGNLPPVLTFNLTGNLLEADRLMFLEAGSSGMLPKPTRFEDFLHLMRKNMGLYINQGMFQLCENRVLMDAGTENELQIGTRYLREAENSEAGALERQKLAGPWAGGATQRSATASKQEKQPKRVGEKKK